MLQTETLSLVRTAPAPDVLEEFEKQVKTYEKAFYHFAYRLTGNHDDAEDLTQEALLKAYRAFHRFKTGTAFDRWVYQIIYRLFIDQYRKKRRRPFVASLDESPPYLDQENRKRCPTTASCRKILPSVTNSARRSKSLAAFAGGVPCRRCPL